MRSSTELRKRLFDHLQKLSMGFYGRQRTGSILSRVLHDVHPSTAVIYGGMIVAALDAVQLLVAFVLLLNISWKLTFGHLGHLVGAYGEVLVHMGTTIVIGYGGYLALVGELTAGTLTRFLGYAIILYGPVRRFSELNITCQTSLAAMGRVFRVFEIPPAVVEGPRIVRTPPKLGAVTFNDVWFRFGETEEPKVRLDEDPTSSPAERCADAASTWIVSGVSLCAAPGQRIAIVGPSGAGKTTLLSLLPRLHDVTRGGVLVDGLDVRDYSLAALRSAIAIVQQESFVFLER